MKNRTTSFLMVMTTCLLISQPTAFAAPETKVPATGNAPQVVSSEEIRTRLLNTLDNAEGTAAGIGMSAILKDQIRSAREGILSATPAELEAIPANLHSSLGILEVGTGQMRLMYDPAMRPRDRKGKDLQKSAIEQSGQAATIQSTGASYNKDPLDEPAYPEDVPWGQSFEVEEPDRNDGEDGPGDVGPDDPVEGAFSGACMNPGSDYEARVAALNAAIVATAVNNITHEFCELVILGFSVTPLCIVTDVIEAIAVGIDANESLCNEHIGAAEVSATWVGIKTVHGNVQHVHDDIADVDSALSLHDNNVRKDITEHDGDIKTQLTAHDVNIDSDLGAHDANIDGDLVQHDTDMKSQLTDHDTTIKAQLATHDADIKARLGDIQATVNENQRLIKVSMSRQAEVMRLLVTAEGRREINPIVLTCTGDDCPSAAEVLTCNDGGGWPCN